MSITPTPENTPETTPVKKSQLNPAKWPINNSTAIYIFTILLLVFGGYQYTQIPKENFPEIKMPQIIVTTIYPGTSPENMENLVTNPIEKQIKSLSGLKKITSNSFQDYSVIIAEFETDLNVDEAKDDVKEAVDKAKIDLPHDMPKDPEIKDIDVSETPILFVNLYGNYDISKLNDYAEEIQDSIEGLKEIKRVEIVGAPEKEMLISLDLFRMQSSSISFGDIENTIKGENLTATAGTLNIDNMKRQISIKKEFKNADDLANVTVNSPKGGTIRLGDIADVTYGFAAQQSFARLYGKNVITLNIIKNNGANLIEASDKIFEMLDRLEVSRLPKDVKISITGDQSDRTRTNLHDLINTIVIGFLLVTVILMFFMGSQNAFFVAMSVPLSCALAFIVFPSIGFTMNMIVLFAFLLALGIVVDDAIVVIENTHRIFANGKVPIKEAALEATREVFLPVLSGTLTTLMPFVPLAFWGGVIGKFMFYLPITLIIVLLASLVVAYLINPVFAVEFMKPHDPDEKSNKKWTKTLTIQALVFGGLSIALHLAGYPALANFSILVFLIILLQKYFLHDAIIKFQNVLWPRVVNKYNQLLKWSLAHPIIIFSSTIVLLIFSIVLFQIKPPKVVFFPKSEPNFAYVYLTLPVGVDQKYTNEVLKQLESRVYKTLEIDPDHNKYNPLVSSVISNVAIGATDPRSMEIGEFPNKGKITVAFVKFDQRDGKSTSDLLNKIRDNIGEIPGATISVEQESSGPPTAKPIAIELTGENLDSLVKGAEIMKRYFQRKNIPGLPELASDFQANKPELVVQIDRNRLNKEGIMTGQVAMALRSAEFGKEISRFRDDKDDYPINIRAKNDQRENIDMLMNQSITYRDMAMGGRIRQVPISSFVTLKYDNTYGGIKRKNLNRIITLSSDVKGGYNANEIVKVMNQDLNNISLPQGVNARMGGDQQEQQETASFLGKAMLISVGLMFIVLMLLFNSIRRTLIILSEIIFAIIGVMFGIALFGIDVSIVMVGVGIVALGGIVVRNGILLIEFADHQLKEGKDPKTAIMEAGNARMTPVLLTAVATILGLIPLAVGLNIDFQTLLSELNPHMYFGGDNVSFWGPLSWTMIYGLVFGTFLTLVLVPVLFYESLILGKKWFNKPYI